MQVESSVLKVLGQVLLAPPVRKWKYDGTKNPKHLHNNGMRIYTKRSRAKSHRLFGLNSR